MENKDLGALWVRSTAKGDKYLTGTISIEGKAFKIVVFKNGFKKAENQPDWRIYESKPKPELNENGTEKVTPQKTDEEEWNEAPF